LLRFQKHAKSSVIIDAEGNYLMPGAIDDQVHFREPGLTYKGDIESESRAAVAGGNFFIEQPNTVPNAVTQEILEENTRWLLRDRMRIIRL
jgi:dihydroorotase